MTTTRITPAARPTATVKLPHPWPFPVLIRDGQAFKVLQPKARRPGRAPAQQFEDAPF